MATAGIGIFSLPLMLLASSLLAVPLAGPPLPLDPVLAAIAPEKCIWYGSSSGIGEPDAESANETEQLFAEPEVRYFGTELRKQLLSALQRSAGARPEARQLATELPKLLQALMSRPLAAFVEDIQFNDEGFVMHAGLVLNAGTQRAELEQSIANLVELSIENGAMIGSVDHDGETWNVMRVSMQTPEVRWGWHENYFLLAIGDGTEEEIIQRMSGSAPAWLDELRRNDSIQRESSLAYLNASHLLDSSRPFLEKQRGWHIVEKLALTSIESCHSINGFDELGCANVTKLVTDGRRRGVLSLLPYKSLSESDLEGIPREVLFASAVRIDAKETWENLVRLVDAFDHRAAERMEDAIRETESKLGVNLQHDVLGSLGDVWTLHIPSGDLMTSWLGSAITCTVKDSRQLQQAMQTMVADVQQKLAAGRGRDVKLRESEFEGQIIYTVDFVGTPLPCSPSWCVTDERLVIGLTPQTVRGMISRIERDSLADVPVVRDSFRGSDRPTSVSYCDTPQLVRSLYPLAQMGLKMLSAKLQREGIEIDTSILPSQETIVRHLRPSVSAMAYTNNGPVFTAQNSLPTGGSGMMLGAVGIGGVAPAAAYWRSAAPKNQALNKMKQIALAILNYEAAYGELPTNIYSDDGEPLLSWRVRVLPFMEQQALYDQFRLNEPWDSAHNLPLSQTIVTTFASPDKPHETKTRYLGLSGEETIFPGEAAVTLRDVTDGLSNTILFIEVASVEAVVWSRPKDLEFDTQRPLRGLENPDGRAAIAMADGSCRWLGPPLSEELVRALATRAGGEAVPGR